MCPRVSVIMPVYNKAPFLAETIESVLSQTYTDFEFLVFDDCSTDGSADIVASYTDPRIKLIRNKQNLGPGGSSNEGIKMAAGEYIVRQDADDISLPDRIESQVRFMDEHPGIGVSSGHLQCFGRSSSLWRVPLSNEEIKAATFFTVPISQPASIIRREVIVKNGIYYGDVSNYIGEDRVLWFRLRNVTDFGNLDKVLIRYRVGEQNMAHDTRFNRMQIRKKIYRFIFKELGIDVKDEEVNIHPFFERIYDKGLDEENIRMFRAWLDKLLAINAERKLFPEVPFKQYADEAWEQLFYRLPPIGYKAVKAYFRCSGGTRPHQLKYYLKYRLNKLLGRK